MSKPKQVRHTYEEFKTAVGLLKQAAIDAYMCHGGQDYFSTDPAVWQISKDGDHYEPNGNWMGAGTWDGSKVRRPDANGDSDGMMWVDGVSQGCVYGTDFKGVCDKIDGYVDRWQDLPSPAKISDVVDATKRVWEGLLINETQVEAGKGDADSATGGKTDRSAQDVNLSSTVGTLRDDAAYLFGTTASNFKTMYLNTTEARINALCDVALELYIHMLRQQAMWDGARKDVMSIIDDCCDKFSTVAAGSSDDWTQVLEILGVINDAVSAVIDNPAVKIASVAAQYGLDKAEESQVKNGKVGTYDKVRAGLEKSLIELNAKIVDQEDNVRRWVVDRLNDIWTRRGNYRLRGGSRDLSDTNPANTRSAAALYYDEVDDPTEFRVGTDPSVRWDFAIAADIYTTMGTLVTLLRDISKINEAPEVENGIRSYVIRDKSIGVGGGYGPSQAVQQLNEAVYDLIDNMAGDWENGANDFQAVTNYFQAKEDGRTADLAQLQQQIDAQADIVLGGTGIQTNSYRNIDWWKKMGGK